MNVLWVSTDFHWYFLFCSFYYDVITNALLVDFIHNRPFERIYFIWPVLNVPFFLVNNSDINEPFSLIFYQDHEFNRFWLKSCPPFNLFSLSKCYCDRVNFTIVLTISQYFKIFLWLLGDISAIYHLMISYAQVSYDLRFFE